MAEPFLGPYNASKFALEALTDSLRLELHASGIEVSIIEPGSVATAIWEKGDDSAKTVVGALSAPARDLYGEAIAAIRATSDAFASRAIPADPGGARSGARAHRAAAEDALYRGSRRAGAGAREVAPARSSAGLAAALADRMPECAVLGAKVMKAETNGKHHSVSARSGRLHRLHLEIDHRHQDLVALAASLRRYRSCPAAPDAFFFGR